MDAHEVVRDRRESGQPRIVALRAFGVLLGIALGAASNAKALDTGLNSAGSLGGAAGACWGATFTLGNVQTSNNGYATCPTTNAQYGMLGSFGNVPTGSTILGITVLVEGSSGTASSVGYTVQLSWDVGGTWTAAQAGSFPNTTDETDTLGGPTFLWGRAWTAAEVSNANFQVRIGRTGAGVQALRVDHIQVRVTYTPPFFYRKSITINRANVTPCGAVNPVDYPMLVSLSATYLRTTTNGGKVRSANGFDIEFRDSGGVTKLDHELESYSPTTGTLVAWVKVPSVNRSGAASDTVIYIYYGNPGITTDQSNPTGVWDSGFQAVWHLKENPAGNTCLGGEDVCDSTSNARDGNMSGAMTAGDQVAGKINGSLDFDGSNDRIDVGSIVGDSAAFTVSLWFRTNTTSSPSKIWGEGDSGSGTPLTYLDINEAGTGGDLEFSLRDDSSTGGGVADPGAGALWNNNVWHLMVGVQTSKSARQLFVDGVSRGTSSTALGTITLNTGNLGAINHGGIDQWYAGGIDEVRISNIGRNACWIGTEYNNQNNPGNEGSPGFYTVGAEQVLVTTAVDLTSFGARGHESAVLLEWATASELDNLGFHLYRAGTANGPWTRLTSGLIQGLGSSPEGKSYSWLDPGLENGTRYFYRLEDVDRSGLATSHGPVSATPAAGLGPSPQPGPSADAPADDTSPAAADWKTHGDPSISGLRVLKSTRSSLTLELTTGGFYTRTLEDGTTRLQVPGFVELGEPGLPRVPTRRAWVDVPAGSQVRVASVAPSDVAEFRGLGVSIAGAPQAVVDRGTYQARFRRVKTQALRRSLYPEALARVLETAFQGETKKAYLELAPLRVGASGQVLLARKLVVRLEFRGRVPGERRSGVRGRLEPGRGRPTPTPSERILVRLATRTAGLQAVSFADVMGGDTTRGVSASSLRLSRLGQAVGFHVEPRADSFGPGSTLYFVAQGPEAAYGTETVYELALGAGGVQMKLERSAREAGKAAVSALVATRVFEQNANYLPALLNARDLWLWDHGVIAPNGRDYSFSLSAPSATAGQAVLSVDVQGGSDAPDLDPDHHARVYVNGVPVGEALWDGLNPARIEASFDAGVLIDGTNTLRLESLDTTGVADSAVYLDRFTVSYPRRLVAEAGRLEGRAPASGMVRASGLSRGTLLLDVTAATPSWLAPLATGGELGFVAESGKSYLAVSPEAVLRPEVRPAGPAAALRSGSLRADWIVIAPQELMPAAEPLVAQRESQGLRAMAVSLERIQDEFGYGERSPQMLRDFLAYAYHHWAQPSVRYVLLLGDASYDPKGYFANVARKDLLPSPLVKSSFLWTVSDPSLGAVNGEDAIPDLAIGRLSAGTLGEAEAAVEKILAFEVNGQTLDGKVVLVADNPDKAGNFEANANDIATLLGGRPVERVFLSELGAGTRSAVLSSFDAGAALVSYVGHGSQALWASEAILRSIDVALLQPQPRQPLLLTMTCSNGYFISPFLNGIAERFVLERDKGAIAAFSPSGLSLDDAAHLFHRALVQQLQGGQHERLGDLVLAAQEDYADTGAFPELLSIYHLFADPALRIRR